MLKIFFLISLVLIFTPTFSKQVYKKIIHNTDPEAKCLDGSPGALYVHEGIQKDKFFIYFIGGGFCGVNTFSGTLEECYKRSKTRYGSSTLWPDELDEEAGAEGILSLNQNLYKNWTKVLFAYCDGAMYQGSNMNPVEYKDTKLYFRGNRIVRSHFKWLIEKYQIDKASKILLSGGSAGGVASIIWGNYLQQIVVNPNIVYNVPDCGVTLNVKTFQTDSPQIQLRVSNVMKLAYGYEKNPLEQCNQQYPGQQWKCTLLEYNYPFLLGKYLFVESQYDSWVIQNVLMINCLKNGTTGQTLKYCSTEELNAIQDYRNKYMKLMNTKVKNDERGTWSIACAKHCYLSGTNSYNSNLERIPSVSGINACQAVEQFVISEKINWTIDQAPWPNNSQCAF